MRSDVAAHVVHACTSFATKSTSKNSIWGMYSAKVFGQITPLEKCTAAHLTSKALLRNMTALVGTTLRLRVKTFIADVTDKGHAACFMSMGFIVCL